MYKEVYSFGLEEETEILLAINENKCCELDLPLVIIIFTLACHLCQYFEVFKRNLMSLISTYLDVILHKLCQFFYVY